MTSEVAGVIAEPELQSPRWFVAQTAPRHEKQVALHLSARGIENFLPLYVSSRRWSDRRIDVALPLFPGYIFVHVPYSYRLPVLQTPSIAGLITVGGRPAPLDDEEIAGLRRGLNDGGVAEPFPHLSVGQRVRVKSGPFFGMVGTLKRKSGRMRLVVSVLLINKSVLLDIDGADVERC